MAACPNSGKALASAVIAPLAVLLVFLSVAKALPSLLAIVVVATGYVWLCKGAEAVTRIPERRLERKGRCARPHVDPEEPTPTKSAGSGPWLEIID